MKKTVIAMIMISSEFGELFSMCDRMLLISNGRQVATMGKGEFDKEAVMDMLTGATTARRQ